jgi:hypothetical protein
VTYGRSQEHYEPKHIDITEIPNTDAILHLLDAFAVSCLADEYRRKRARPASSRLGDTALDATFRKVQVFKDSDCQKNTEY